MLVPRKSTEHFSSLTPTSFDRFSIPSTLPNTPSSDEWSSATTSFPSFQLSLSTSTSALSGQDIFVGVVIALVLAFTASFLQGRRADSDFVLWEEAAKPSPRVMSLTTPIDGPIDLSNSTAITDDTSSMQVFGGESWKEMSKPDNYVLYNRKVRGLDKIKKGNNAPRIEQTWVLVALLALFVPIFSIELFFALSRQLICDSGANAVLDRPDWAELLCSPAASEGIVSSLRWLFFDLVGSYKHIWYFRMEKRYTSCLLCYRGLFLLE